VRRCSVSQFHFDDEQRLFDVIIACHHVDETIPYDDLTSDLTRAGFDDAARSQLASRIEQGLDLLHRYDQVRGD
jgi:hypothetical protein